jgi:hypothetical protein
VLSDSIPRDLCPHHWEAANAWRNNHYSPWNPTEWPGGSHILDSRTTHAEREAEWDRKNRERMAFAVSLCRRQCARAGDEAA